MAKVAHRAEVITGLKKIKVIYRALTGKLLVVLIHVSGWSPTRDGRRWRFGRNTFLSVYDTSQITVDVQISFSAVTF